MVGYGHCVRSDYHRNIKQLFFLNEKARKRAQKIRSLKENVEKIFGLEEYQIIQMAFDREF